MNRANGTLRRHDNGYTLSYTPPNPLDVERLAVGGALSTLNRQARATQRAQIVRERIAGGLLLVLAAVAAVVIFGGE